MQTRLTVKVSDTEVAMKITQLQERLWARQAQKNIAREGEPFFVQDR